MPRVRPTPAASPRSSPALDGWASMAPTISIPGGVGEGRPTGLRHTAITEACKLAQAKGMGLEEGLDFSRHRDVKVLMVYRDRERNVQGQLATLVAAGVGGGQGAE